MTAERRPRRGLPTADDIEAALRRLSDRQRARVEAAALADEITVEVHIRRRWAVCARALIGPRWAKLSG